MLIDDNEIDNLINQKMIESVNLCENILVYSGARSALEYLKNIESIKNIPKDVLLPEYIFLDVDMPFMDGFQFMDEFRKLSDEVKVNCKIILLTSSIDPKDIQKSKKDKFIMKYLTKPLTQENLKKITE
jgi:CheY-like chemotaxis protein